MPCQVFRHTSRNKPRRDINEVEIIIHKIIFDNEKFRLLKENLRNKDVATNGAIKQYLLQYDKSLGISKLEADRKIYGIPKTNLSVE